MQLQKAIEKLSYNQETDIKLLMQFFDPENNPEKMALDLFDILKEAKDKGTKLVKPSTIPFTSGLKAQLKTTAPSERTAS